MSGRWGVQIAVVASVLVVAALAGSERAAADCQLQWQPDPFGESGGSLVPVCDGPFSPDR